jgi:hypothetical protein
MSHRSIRFGLAAVLVILVGVVTLPAQVRHPHARFSYGMVGILSGESLVVSVANPHSQYPPNPCRIVVLDGAGATLYDSGLFLLPAVQTHFVTINWGDLPAVQDQEGRKAVRVVIHLTASTSEWPPDPCAPSLELVTAETGATFAIAPLPVAQFSD